MAEPSKSTIKKLFGPTGNRCAFPGCSEILVPEPETVIGEVCHICGDKLNAKRYDPKQTEAERQATSNLMVLCPTHHTIIDSDENLYTVERLKRMKAQHEAKSTKPFLIGDKTADRILFIMGGAVGGVGLTELAKGLGHIFGRISGVLGKPDKSKKEKQHEIIRREVVEIFGYAPKGAFSVFARERVPLGLCLYFTDLFATNGWRLLEEPVMKISDNTLRNFDATTFGMAFFLSDRNQLSNAKQAIDEVFTKYEFKKKAKGAGDEWFGAEHGFTALIFMAATK